MRFRLPFSHSFRLFSVAKMCGFFVCQMIRAHAADPRDTSDVNFGVNNWGSGYTYTVLLNGEPIRYGSGPGLVVIRGYPLREGTNKFLATIGTSGASNATTNVRMEASIRPGKEWMLIDEFRENLLVGDSREWSFEFEVTNRVEQMQAALDDLSEDADRHSNESRRLTVELARTIASRDLGKITRVLSSTNEEQIAASYPTWFFDERVGEVTTTCVTNSADVTTVMGKRLILCRPARENRSPSSFGLVCAKKTKGNAVAGHDYFILGRVNGRWGLFSPEIGWRPLDTSALDLHSQKRNQSP